VKRIKRDYTKTESGRVLTQSIFPPSRLPVICLSFALALVRCTPRSNATDAGTLEAHDASKDAAEASAADAAILDDALPPSESDDLTTRARHLLEAIAKDDPSLATDIVFPRDAYLLAKDAADPGKQWDAKVMGAFRKQVHIFHKRMSGLDHAQFTTFEIGQPIAQVVPKRRDMRMTLWRVRHSRLNFAIDGKAARFDIGELISWKGAWYVTQMR
jgi:hypothetical protein